MARRRNSGRNDLVRLIGLLTLYAIIGPDSKPKVKEVRKEKPMYVSNVTPNQQSGANGSTGGDPKLGCGIIALVLIIMSAFAECYELIFLIIFAIIIAAFMNNESDSSGGNVSQTNQQFAANQGNAQYAGSEQNIYTRRSAEPLVPNLATHIFVPDELLADLLKDVRLSERMRYLNVDSVEEIIEKFPTCIADYDVADFRKGERSIMRAKRRVVPDKYRYMPADFNPNLVVPIATVAAMAAPAAAMYYYDDDSDDDDEVSFWGNSNSQEQTTQQRPAWQDPYAYHGTEQYDEFYNLREDEYRQEYGEDFEDAIDDEYEDTYINK